MTLTPEVFVAGRPCIEEIEGYRDELRARGIEVEAGGWEALLAYERRLMQGLEMPRESKLARTWIYQWKRKPRKGRTP